MTRSMLAKHMRSVANVVPKSHMDKLVNCADENDKINFLSIGQIQFAKEAAGKLRVFAMVDLWTQSMLSPLHTLLSKILRSLPNDGTFNQEASLVRAREKSIKYGCSYGYDLSAATDRLPIFIQVIVLRALFERLGYSAIESEKLADL